MSLSIQNGNIVLPNDRSLSEDVQWTPNEGSPPVSGGNYGSFRGVELDNNSVTVKTNTGKLRFPTRPPLDPVRVQVSNDDYSTTTESLSGVNINLSMQLIELMAKISVTLSTAERTVREEERKSAFAKGMQAADKIMQGAMTNLIMGVTAGSVSIVAGMASAIAQARAMSKLGEPVENLGMAKLESDVATVETDLRQTNLDIAEMKQADPNLTADANGTPDQQRLFRLEQRSTELKANRTSISENLDQKITKTQEKLQTANDNVDEARNNLGQPPTEKQQDNLAAAQQKQQAINNRLNRLNGIKNKMDTFSEPPNPESITGASVDPNDPSPNGLEAMQSEFDKTQNWNNSGRNWAQVAQEQRSQSYTELNIVLQKVQQQVGLTQGLLSVAQGVSQSLSVGGGYAEAQGQAEAKQADARAQQDQSRMQEADSDLNRNLDTVKKFLDLWDQIAQMQTQAQRDILA